MTRSNFIAARLAGRGNFSGPLPNVAGVDGGHFNEKKDPVAGLGADSKPRRVLAYCASLVAFIGRRAGEVVLLLLMLCEARHAADVYFDGVSIGKH
ncbi:MAG: hypothetical protein JO189_14480 [Deltaproteobacteria bacterium]|nr:hypothetical protein [Deltaproteobacteria bacterium]